MRVCYVSGYYDPQTMRTPEDCILRAETWRELAREQARSGIETHVITLFRQDAELRDEGVYWHFVRAGAPWAILGRLVAKLRAPRLRGADFPYYQLAFSLARTIRRTGPSLIHFFGLTMDLNLRLVARTANQLQIPLVVHYHGGYPSRNVFRRLVQRANLRSADRILFTAAAQAQPWRAAGVLDDAQRVFECMETSTTFAGLPKGAAREKTRMSGDPIFVWAGRLHPIKDPLTALMAFEAIASQRPEAQLYLHYTSEELLPQLGEFVRARPALAARIHFRGCVPHREMEAIFSASDFLLQASRREFSGLAVLEAMACGAIPVVTDIPPFRVMTERGRVGILFPVGDYTSLVNQVLSVGREELEKRSRSVKEKFRRDLSYPALAGRLRALYAQLCQSGRQNLSNPG